MNRALNFGVFVTPFHPHGQFPTGLDEAWFGEHQAESRRS
jgi:limonene 1,2-monooxygenase